MNGRRIRVKRKAEEEVESYRVGKQVFRVGDYVRVIGFNKFYRIVVFDDEGRYALLTEVPNRGVNTQKDAVALSLLLLLDSEDVEVEIDIAERRVSDLQDILDYIWEFDRVRSRKRYEPRDGEESEEHALDIEEDYEDDDPVFIRR